MSGGIETAERIVKAPAEAIFAVLADPSRHKDIDGSGTVKGSRDTTPARLSLGATFGMDMKMGAPYKITNTVVEFEEGRRIAWRHFGGHVWRYILEPQADGTTKVTEQFDWTTSKSKIGLRLMGAPKRNKKAMVATLDRLATVVG
jgi:uncharacterized protein YndB with AHSA1/START domain